MGRMGVKRGGATVCVCWGVSSGGVSGGGGVRGNVGVEKGRGVRVCVCMYMSVCARARVYTLKCTEK